MSAPGKIYTLRRRFRKSLTVRVHGRWPRVLPAGIAPAVALAPAGATEPV